MFQGNVFRLNKFVIALFTSDVGFSHVSCMVVNFGFVLRCCTLVTVVSGNVLPNILLVSTPASPIIAAVFLHRPIFQLAIWPHNSPNFGSFGHSPPLLIYPSF